MSDSLQVARPHSQDGVGQHYLAMPQQDLPSQQSILRDGPVPMSMPAILRNPRASQAAPVARQTRDGYARGSTDMARHVGKRRARRSENGKFASNPHAVRPGPADYLIPTNQVRSTFTEHTAVVLNDLYLNRASAMDACTPVYDSPAFDIDSAMKGQFTMSLRDAHGFLRARLGHAELMQAYMDAVKTMTFPAVPAARPSLFLERLIFTAQHEMGLWLHRTEYVHMDDEMCGNRVMLAHPNGREESALMELRQTPTLLIWRVDDASARLAIHCVARTLNCPSFSRTTPVSGGLTDATERTTWILHPNPLLRARTTQRAAVRRSRHRRNSSASTASSVSTSAVMVRSTMPLAMGLLQHGSVGMETPPSTDYELTDSVDEFVDSDLAGSASELDM